MVIEKPNHSTKYTFVMTKATFEYSPSSTSRVTADPHFQAELIVASMMGHIPTDIIT